MELYEREITIAGDGEISVERPMFEREFELTFVNGKLVSVVPTNEIKEPLVDESFISAIGIIIVGLAVTFALKVGEGLLFSALGAGVLLTKIKEAVK